MEENQSLANLDFLIIEHCRTMYKASDEDPATFYGDLARDRDIFYWESRFTKAVLDFKFDRAKGAVSTRWFEDSATNLRYNRLGKIIEGGFGTGRRLSMSATTSMTTAIVSLQRRRC